VKKIFEDPELELLFFDPLDIITESPGGEEEEEEEEEEGGGGTIISGDPDQGDV